MKLAFGKDDLTELKDSEWGFEEFKRERMQFWMGEASSEKSNIEVDEGFADVDKAVGAEKGIDHTGGRGINGAIAKDLEEAR